MAWGSDPEAGDFTSREIICVTAMHEYQSGVVSGWEEIILLTIVRGRYVCVLMCMYVFVICLVLKGFKVA